jgi:excisionase family DNA binding protein
MFKGLTVREAATRLKIGKTTLYEALKSTSIQSNKPV